MNFKNKYKDLGIVLFFILLGLIVTLILSVIKYYLDGKPILELMEVPFFIAVIGFIIGILYCEIRYFINNRHWGALTFGLISPLIFLFSLLAKSLLTGEAIKEMPFGFFITIELMMGVVMYAVYIGVTPKNS